MAKSRHLSDLVDPEYLKFRDMPEIVIPPGAPIHFESGMKYECIQCGFGCRTMEVQFDRASWDTLNAFPIEEILERSPKISPIVHDGTQGYCALRQIEGRCVFLEGTSQCVLHKEFGYDSKPQACRDFPFRYTVTPDGVYVGLSFACSAILQEEGPPVETHEPTIRGQISGSLNLQEGGSGESVQLTDAVSVSWRHYIKIEEMLQELIGQNNVNFNCVLRSGYILLRLLADFITKAGESGESVDLAIEHFAAKMLKERFALPISLAQKPISGKATKRVFLGTLIHFRNTIARKQNTAAAAWDMTLQYIRHLFCIGKIEMLPLNGRFPWWAIKHTRTDWDDSFYEYQHRRFLRHQVFRKDLIAHYPVLKAWGITMAQHALARWYAIARAHLQESPEVRREDFYQGIRHVETHYSHHFTFKRVFEQMPALWMFIDRLLDKERYPYIITSEP